MEADVKTEGSNKRLNDLVAVTVVILSVFMAVGNIKDGNIGQAMQKAKADAVDAWSEYQAARVKLHVDENGLAQLRLLETAGNFDRALAAKQAAEYDADIKKYEARSKETRAKAERLEKEYDQLNFRDDQFDMLREDLLRYDVNFPCIEIAAKPNVVEIASWEGDRMSRISLDALRTQLPSIMAMELAKVF